MHPHGDNVYAVEDGEALLGERSALGNRAVGTNLSAFTAGDLRQIQRSLNNRPRKTLDYLSPLEKYAELVASTG